MRRSTLPSFWAARPAAYPFFSLLLAAAPGCDDPDELLHVDIADEDELAAEDIAAMEAEDADWPEQPTPADGELALANPQSTEGAVPWQTFEVFPPIRMDDLKPNHYPVIKLLGVDEDGVQENKWHDLVIRRYEAGWRAWKPNTTVSEPNEVSWDTPVYAGVDGEVMSCWRTAPYEDDFASIDSVLTISGNFMVIKTADDMWLHYAHLNTNSIPSELCPNVSVNGGYLAPNSEGVRVCGNLAECSVVEQYLPAGSRPQIHKGQFIGRIGAVGQARGAHLHMRAGTVARDTPTSPDRLVQSNWHIIFENTWQAPLTGTTLPINWTLSSGMSIPEAVTTDHTLLWTGKKREETYASSDYRLSSYGGGVGVDLLCHDTDNGNLYIDGNDSPVPYGATNWQGSATWCTAASARLHTGDFNGDGRTDLLCHNRDTGSIQIDHGVFNANNGYTEYTGVDFTRPNPWCMTDTTQLLIGNFDDDAKDDLLCHDHASGTRWLDRSSNGFGLTDHTFTTPWCAGHYQRLHVGRFDPISGGDDLLCHDTLSGQIWIDATPNNFQIANGTPIFGATDTHVNPWCAARGHRLFSGNVVTSGTSWYDELICHDSDTGRVYINNAGTNFDYPGTSSQSGDTGHCTDEYDRVKIGDVNGDNKDDLVCFNQRTGARSVDYAAFESSTGGLFAGAEWTSSDNGWCRNAQEALR